MKKSSKIIYLFFRILVFVCFLFIIFLVFYLKIFKNLQKKDQSIKIPTPTKILNYDNFLNFYINKIKEDKNYKTYKNFTYRFAFDYPENYIFKKIDCKKFDFSKYNENIKPKCLLALSFNSVNNRHSPTGEFFLLQGIKFISIAGQVSGIEFDSKKGVWILNRLSFEPDSDIKPMITEIIPVWGYTKSGKEILKSFNGGSTNYSHYYIIPDYQKDQVAIFSVPMTYRFLCEFYKNEDKDDCSSFYKSVVKIFKKDDSNVNVWLSEEYLSFIYSQAEKMIKSYRQE